MKRNTLLLRIAGVSGVCSAIFVLIWLPEMISSVLGFSYTQNWISDLGGMESPPFVHPDVTTPLTVMLVVVGTLNMVFAIGLLHDTRTTFYCFAAVSALVSSISIIGFGVITEDPFGGVPHFVFALMSFLLLRDSGVVIAGEVAAQSLVEDDPPGRGPHSD